MTPSLFVLSPDSNIVNQLRDRFSGTYDVVVAGSLGTPNTRLESAPAKAALAHLTSTTLNGHSPRAFLNKLQQVVHTTPIYGLIDSDCPPEFVDLATKAIRTCLPVPFGRATVPRTI